MNRLNRRIAFAIIILILIAIVGAIPFYCVARTYGHFISNSDLYYAARYEGPEKVRWFLKCGASPNELFYDDSGGWGTALDYACQRGNIEAVQLLLEHGADPNLRSPGGRTSLESSIYYLAKYYPDKCIPIVKMLLAHGVRVNVGLDHEYSALLQISGEFGQSEVVELLIRHGADVNQFDDFRMPAITAATYAEDRDTVCLLLAAGANPNLRGAKMKIPLEVSVENGHWEYISLFVAYMIIRSKEQSGLS